MLEKSNLPNLLVLAPVQAEYCQDSLILLFSQLIFIAIEWKRRFLNTSSRVGDRLMERKYATCRR